MNSPVKFELAKLLKEKGFTSVFTSFSNKYFNSLGEYKVVSYNVKIENDEYEAPIIAEIVMWLYEKHRIWISVIDVSPSHILWEYQISRKEVGLIYSSGQYPVKHNYSPTEAYEAAIEYTLKNLIP